MILCDFFVTETKEARGAIVKDVTLLLRCQEAGCLDRLNSNFNGSRPNHLIRSKKNPLSVSSLDQAP
jgi:hypothetical protein